MMIDQLWTSVGVLLGIAMLLGMDRIRVGAALSRTRRRNQALTDELRQLESTREARSRAEAASEAKSRFLATVSHEIRTPLNGILGIAELLQGTPLDREQFAYVEAVRTSGQALATLIDEILDFSRIEAGKLELGAEPFDLASLVEAVVELLAPRAQDKGIEIAAFIDPALPRRIVGDPVKLRQVLTNLAGNAVKFTEAGGVGIKLERVGDELLSFSVSDTGPGVPTDRREAIFEEFEQGDGTATRRHGGTGLGLAISRRIVDRMGGMLTLEDRPGGGSVFGFTVKLDAAEDEVVVTELGRSSLAGRRVLIAARSPFQAPFLAARLEADGAEVTSLAQDEAIRSRLDTAGPFDLVFIDCALGEARTESLLAAAHRAGAHRIFLLFSPFERRAFGQKLVAGFDGWLVKPIRDKSLTARIGGPVAAPLPTSVTPSPPRTAQCRSLRVLLAEDNEINALVAMSYLGRIGAQAVHAADGKSALALALAAMRGETPPFDAIVMDVSMPELDGLEVSRRLRMAEAAERFPATRVVGLTAHAFAEDRTEFLGAGMDDVMIKPIDFARFSNALLRQDDIQRVG